MVRNKLIAIAATALLTLSVASYANQASTDTEATPVVPEIGSSFNMFDPNTWMNGFGTPTGAVTTELTFNAAHPTAWMKFIDPTTHQSMHKMFTNPTTYVQFMQPRFYIEFMRPENWMAWMNPASYQVLMNPQSMSYWMNPASYMHGMDPAMYTEAMNLANYMVYLNPATYAGLAGSTTCDPNNPDNTLTWFGPVC